MTNGVKTSRFTLLTEINKHEESRAIRLEEDNRGGEDIGEETKDEIFLHIGELCGTERNKPNG